MVLHAEVEETATVEGQDIPLAIVYEDEAILIVDKPAGLVVHPAAGLPELARRRGARLVIINRDPTDLDRAAEAVIREPIGSALTAIDRAIEAES